MERKRKGYGFTNEEKVWARDRANGKCEIFYPDCQRPNTGRVNHITGVFEGRLKGMPKETVSDIKHNSALLCRAHEETHDLQEKENIQKYLNPKMSRRIFPSPFNAGEIIWRNRR